MLPAHSPSTRSSDAAPWIAGLSLGGGVIGLAIGSTGLLCASALILGVVIGSIAQARRFAGPMEALGDHGAALAQQITDGRAEQATLTLTRDAVFDALGEGVIVVDSHGAPQVVNSAAGALLAVPLERARPREWAARCGFRASPEDDETLPPEDVALIAALGGGEPARQELFIRNEGRPEGLWLAVTASPIRGPDGELRGGVVVLRDISSQRTAEISTRMLQEVHHRVKNNLQVVQGLLDLQARRIADPTAVSALRESRSRIRAMASMHEQLYRDPGEEGLDFRAWLERMIGDVRQGYDIDPSRISLELEADPVKLSMDVSVPTGLAVHELVTNALQHAFPGGRTGKVRVTLRSDGDFHEISVADDGAGLPAGMDFRRSRSLGLHLVVGLVRQIRGVLSCVSEGGTDFRISFRDNRGGPKPMRQG